MGQGTTGEPRKYHQAAMFAVEIAGVEISWFETCSEIGDESGVIEQREGGLQIPAEKQPGLANWPNVTLGNGVTDNTEMYDWRRQVVAASGETGEPDEEYKKNVAIVQKRRDGTELGRWNLFNAWPRMHKRGPWDAKAEEFTKEISELVIKRAEWVPKAA